MDKIILGILMLNRMTAYEIKNVIKLSYKSICSDSLGSIQAALKKLFDLDMVTFEEVVENGVNKKRYAIKYISFFHYYLTTILQIFPGTKISFTILFPSINFLTFSLS